MKLWFLGLIGSKVIEKGKKVYDENKEEISEEIVKCIDDNRELTS